MAEEIDKQIWEYTRDFCNRVLRWGMEREAERLEEERKAARLQRMKIEWRVKRNAAYREVNPKVWNLRKS